MKKLYIVRHAKSSWKDPKLTDIERPLNGRGRRDAPIMAAYLVKILPSCPDMFIASPSRRTRDTAEEFAKKYGKSTADIELTRSLYHASSSSIRRVIADVSEDCNSVVLFGHNPGVTDFVNDLCAERIINIPTCGVAGISLSIETWKQALTCTGILDFYQYPKGIEG